MTLIDFLHGIDFYQTGLQDAPPDFTSPQAKFNYEVNNTHLPAQEKELKALLGPLCHLPKMSTFAIAVIIQKLVAVMPAELAFLNLGTWCGFSLFAGMANQPHKICLGVDNFSLLVSSDSGEQIQKAKLEQVKTHFYKLFQTHRSAQHQFYETDVQNYWQIHQSPIGVYFYDADHAYQAQLEGLKQAEPWLAPGAFVLVDDILWPEVSQALADFLTQSRERYQVILEKRPAYREHPTFWNGLCLLQKVS